MKTNALMRGRHNKKTSAFVKSCIAFCHITIPSLNDVLRKLELMLLCAQVALQCQCLPQTDTMLKSAISLLPEVPPSLWDSSEGKKVYSGDRMVEFLRNLLSTLVVVPGHPEHGPFYIVQGLLNALPRYEWSVNSPALKTRVYTEMLALLATYRQKRFPYSIQGVESNDELFGGAPGYHKELSELTDTCFQAILLQLTEMGERPETTAKVFQARTILNLVGQIVARMELGQGSCVFVLKLMRLAAKSKQSFTRNDLLYFNATIEATKKECSGNEEAVELLQGLQAL
jgi:hypothetical protein